MKHLATFIIILFAQMAQSQNDNDSFAVLWKQVEQLENDALTQSALKLVASISDKAKKEKNSPQIVKALLYSSKYVLILEEDAQLKIVNDFKQEIEKAEFPTANILESYLANLYWQYFKKNRYRFYGRSETVSKVDRVDFRTWDLTTLFYEIDQHYEASLQNVKELTRIPISEFDYIIYEQPNTRNLRPTLFDLLAHTALEFYKTSENSITRPANKFEIDNPALLCEAIPFLNFKIDTTDKTSSITKTLLIYQELLNTHISDASVLAFTDVDIERLQFIHENAIFNNKDELYIKVLKNIIAARQKSNNGVIDLYQYELAAILQKQGQTYQPTTSEIHRWKLKEALAICEMVIEKFPDSRGAEKCLALKMQILHRNLELTAENYIPIGTDARILVNYKNHDFLNLSALKIGQKERMALEKLYKQEEKLEFLRKLTAVKEWTAQLRNENDYQKHSTEIVMPPLESGYYIILAQTPMQSDKTLAYSYLQVTDLAVTEVQNHDHRTYQIINRKNGGPIARAKVSIQYSKNHNNKRYTLNKISDEKGQVHLSEIKVNWTQVQIEVSHQKDNAFFGDYYIYPQSNPTTEDVNSKIFVFTDRSIYRPGQTLHFKGILIETFKGKSKILPEETVYITLFDANDQEVSEQELETNEFGSFAGEFILPSNGLTGEFYLEIDADSKLAYEEFYFSVEEYKRPKFQTSFEPISETYKVNDSVTVHGIAKAYSGSNITNAKVSYRVKRAVQYPRWYYGYRPYFNSTPQEISHGETTTDESGKYKIIFKAIADTSVDIKNTPTFNYEITADVTDINGETHSTSTTVVVGYHTLTATIQVPSSIDKDSKKNNLTISTNNLNGEFVAARGNLKMYKLKSPENVLRPRPWDAPDYAGFNRSEFKRRYPHDAYENEHDPGTWKKGELVWQSHFDTDISNELTLGNIKKWMSGKYIIELESKDKFGQIVKDIAQTNLMGTKDRKLADNQLFQIKTNKNSYEVGDEVKVTLSSNSEDINVMVYVEKSQKVVESHLIHLNKDLKSLTIPVSPKDIGGFAITYSFAVYNHFETGNLNIVVPYPKTDLEIETISFRDKLQPGTDETWSFKVKGPKGEKVVAEFLANMYDASLDAFREHDWYFNPLRKQTYATHFNSNANNSFGINNFRVFTDSYYPTLISQYLYDSFEWFGLSFSNSSYAQQSYLKRMQESRKSNYYSNDEVPKGFVNGVIYDQDGVPLPGVIVKIEGTTIGTYTDFDGEFSIQVEKGKTLEFSSIGLISFRKKIGDDNFLEIYMSEDSNTLDEVVVTAMGIKKEKKALGYAVSSVGSEEIDSMSDVLPGGKVAGIQIIEGGVASPKAEKTSDQIQIRKNLQENAFFFPQLRTDAAGNVSFNFTTPEALTKWNVQLLAHTKNLETSYRTLQTVTQKELMVTPNAPRFLREGDLINISCKISNLTAKNLSGIAKLKLVDALTGKEVSNELLVSSLLGGKKDEIQKSEAAFVVDSLGNTQVSWNLLIPKQIQAVQYTVTAHAGAFSDGEQNVLPVLTNRMLVTETLPMWVGSHQTKSFTLEKLKTVNSATLKHHKLTLEMTGNPAWYAVQALPYLMEFPYECNEQTFAKYYANTLATHIANSNPRIQDVFTQWANSDALVSNLEKNQELKSLLIQETPWLRDAQSETEQKKRIALLFNLNNMRSEQAAALDKLKQNQKSSGAWPWFNGGPDSRFVTQHIIAGMGHLKNLAVTSNGVEMQNVLHSAMRYLDNEFTEEYERMKRYAGNINDDHLSETQIHYLYMRSFFKEVKISKRVEEITAYYKGQIQKYWKNKGLYAQGMLALIVHRQDDGKTSEKILRALKENSITSDELGMYWKENTSSWHWYQAPIETQALLIEAFSEIHPKDNKTLDNLKIWLLKNKQTNQWKTTKATTEAVYALLLQGNEWLSITDAVDVLVGGQKIKPSQLENVKVEAGTGYYKTAWRGTEVLPEMAEVQISKKGDGIAWGALYWQYFEDLDKITSAETPLKLKKKLFLKKNTARGEEIAEINSNTPLSVGNLVRVRIELRADRPMEFVHMKDMRAAGFEPINVISKYKWQDGLGYYEATKDASTNFFFDYLPKGVYVFEYDVRVNNAGYFSNGITTIQSMYAPEFSSHSEGARVQVN